MLEQVNKGKKLGFTLNDEAWRDRVYPFNKVFRLYSMKDFVNGRCDCLKRQYEYIRNVLGRRGFPWEGLKKLVPADYDAYGQVHLDLCSSYSYNYQILFGACNTRFM